MQLREMNEKFANESALDGLQIVVSRGCLAFEQRNRHACVKHHNAGPETKSCVCLAQSYGALKHSDCSAGGAPVRSLPLLLIVCAEQSFGWRREERLELETDHCKVPGRAS